MRQRGWAIVTGASAGLRYVFVKELVRAGYAVLAVARRRDRLDRLAAEMAKRGGKVEPLVADLKTAPAAPATCNARPMTARGQLLRAQRGVD